jgi:peptidoglycan/LPS O-acetylase OafA/YrhL
LRHPKYRPDIDGLRAVAVLSVVLYHTFPKLLPGGFIGVDIFFVISGFLISTIIFENLARGSFSFVEFYVRRIKRIFPALAVVLLAGLAFGWFGLLADEYKQLGYHSAGAAGFVANLLLWQESGYFDAAASTKPLLHLWSLGVEEQFYIVWPLLLWLAWKCRANSALVVVAVGAVSFWLNLDRVDSDPIAAFFSPQTRFWELLIGALLACPSEHREILVRRVFGRPAAWLQPRLDGRALRFVLDGLPLWRSLIGAACVVAGLLLISGESHFPGTWALLPTVGAALVISAGPLAIVNRAILSNRVAVWFGLISYPLYLWHWPLLSLSSTLSYTPFAARRVTADDLRIAAMLLSFPLAWLTYSIVEVPIRFGGQAMSKAIALAATMLIIGTIGYGIYDRDGLPLRNKAVNQYLAYFENSKPRYKYFEKLQMLERYRTDCNFYDVEKDRNGHPTQVPIPALDRSCYTKAKADDKIVFIWGDSHASQLYYGIEQTLAAGWEILIVATSGCPVSVDAPQNHKEIMCDKSNALAMTKIAEVRPDVVLIGQLHALTAAQMRRVATKLREIGVGKVVFTGPDPQWETALPTIVARRLQFAPPEAIPERSFLGLRQDIVKTNDELLKETANGSFIYVDLIGLFCNSSGCLTRIGNALAEDSVTWDYGHLTPVASTYLARSRLAKVLFEGAGSRK